MQPNAVAASVPSDQTAVPSAGQATLHRGWWIALLAVVLIGGAIRASAIVDRPLWEDESYTWKDSQLPYYRLLWWKYFPNQGPLGYLSVKHSIQLFGTDAPWALRMPSLLCGILCIPAAFYLGRVVHSPLLGLIAAALVAIDPNMVDQSQQARMYTMFALAWLVALARAIQLLRAPPAERRPWLGLGLLLSLLIYVNFGAIAFWVGLIGAALLLAVLRRDPARAIYRRRVARGLVTAYGLAALVSLRGIYRFVRFVASDHAPGTVDVEKRLQAFWDGLEQLVGAGTFVPVAALLAVVGLGLLARHCRTAAAVVAITGAVGAVMIYRGQSVHDVFAVRYLTVVQPALWIGLAALPVLMTAVVARLGCTLLLALFCVMQSWQCTQLERWNDFKLWRFVRVASDFVQETRADGDQFACSPNIHLGTLARYYDVANTEPTQGQSSWMVAFMHNFRAEDEVRKFLHDAAQQGPIDIDVEKTIALCKARGHVVLRLDQRQIQVWEFDAQRDGLMPLPTALSSELARARTSPASIGQPGTTVR